MEKASGSCWSVHAFYESSFACIAIRFALGLIYYYLFSKSQEKNEETKRVVYYYFLLYLPVLLGGMIPIHLLRSVLDNELVRVSLEN